jgi:hypothetical protein
MKKTPFYQMMRHKVAWKSLFTAIKEVCLRSEKGQGQTLVGAVPGMFQSALSGVVAMVFFI